MWPTRERAWSLVRAIPSSSAPAVPDVTRGALSPLGEEVILRRVTSQPLSPSTVALLGIRSRDGKR